MNDLAILVISVCSAAGLVGAGVGASFVVVAAVGVFDGSIKWLGTHTPSSSRRRSGAPPSKFVSPPL